MRDILEYRRIHGKDPKKYIKVDRYGDLTTEEGIDFLRELRAQKSEPFDCPFVRIVKKDFRFDDRCTFEEGDIICLHGSSCSLYSTICRGCEINLCSLEPWSSNLRTEKNITEFKCPRIGGRVKVEFCIKKLKWAEDNGHDVKKEFLEADSSFREKFKKRQDGNLFSCFSELEKQEQE